ncbi:SCO3242 family prenyltransferase [Streptomyces polyrhachis]|uniref:SCO3242 family prenyltransferase n=1 Tax=Streptomyces polyrhachis TaxID=1282885 RepID=A0ABW2GNI1_9ACTN
MNRRAWAELLRLPALFTIPGDALAGAAAAGVRPGRRTALAAGASVCLYGAGMALNDYADREVDAVERPHRPIPSGRIAPRAALAAAGALTGAGLALAAAAGRRPLGVGAALAATVWAYDLRLKQTAAGPAAMAAARGLDLLLGAAAGGSPTYRSHQAPSPLGAAAFLAAHTYAVTAVSRNEAWGGRAATPAAALAGTLAVADGIRRGTTGGSRDLTTAACLTYAAAAARPYAHAALNPSPHLTRTAVGAGIGALLPLQAALAARRGAPATAAALLALIPLARRQSGKVSVT